MKVINLKNVFKRIFVAIALIVDIVFVVIFGWIWLKLNYNIVFPYNKSRLQKELIQEYNVLKSLLDKPDPKTKTITDGWRDFQSSEWPFQVLSLFCYGTRNLVKAGILPRQEAAQYMKKALERAMQPEYYNFIVGHFGDPFHSEEIKDNAFYPGHFTNMLALYREVSGDASFDDWFHKFAQAFYENFKLSPTGCLDSYSGMGWTSEQVVPLRALKYHDEIFRTNYMKVVNRWKDIMSERFTHPKANVLVTGVDKVTGHIWQGPRAIPNTWTILFLHEVLPDYCKRLYKNTKNAFLVRRLGFTLFKEWLEGPQVSDGDTGPIIWGVSAVSTCFGMGNAGVYGDGEVFWGINILADTFGLPFTYGAKRRYLLGGNIGTACAYLCRSMAVVSLKEFAPFPLQKIIPIYLIVSVLLLIFGLRIKSNLKSLCQHKKRRRE
jgi:hypothetical protein